MSKTINDGGPAFPVEVQSRGDGTIAGLQTSNHSGWELGMTLRDYFAAKALVSIGAYVPRGDAFDADAVAHAHTLASHAYMIADVMLAIREEQGSLRRPEPDAQCVMCGCKVHPSSQLCSECACEDDGL